MHTGLKDELHVHLYGCLTAPQLFELGRDLWPKREARLDWYAAEYEKAWGRRPDWRAYWHSPQGFDLLARDFEFRSAQPFARFQACFNLAIALFPVSANDTSVLRLVLPAQREIGLRYGEYRCPVPPTLSISDLGTYFANQAQATAAIERESGGAFTPRLAFSLNRDPDLFQEQYRVLKGVLQTDADARRVIVAMDLCGVEEGNPPKRMVPLIAKLKRDNAQDPDTALAVLYHVGESFEDMTLASAVRWVHEAHALGADRLGHALALGLKPESLVLERGLSKATERVTERLDHLAWLDSEAHWLGDCGYQVDRKQIKAATETLSSLNGLFSQDLDDAYLADVSRLQDAVIKHLARRGAVVECCPTSNLRIGRLGSAANHPLPRFLDAGIRVVLSSDDPGIFATSLAKEECLVGQDMGVSDQGMAQLAANGEAARSRRL